MNTPVTEGNPNSQSGYTWESPDGARIELSFDVVDRMLSDVMRGFGAVPKRGAEVGGILLGTVDSGANSSIRINDYVEVPIEYRRGPSYLLSEDDERNFEEALVAARRGGPSTPVGFFRSHTRDSDWLTQQDQEFCAKYFPSPLAPILLIKPYATRVSAAGFFLRQDGVFAKGAPASEFPFRRRELGGGEPEERSGRRERRRRGEEAVMPAPKPTTPEGWLVPALTQTAEIGPITPEIALFRKRTRLEWLRLPFWGTLLLLVLGAMLGYEASVWWPALDVYRFGLGVKARGEDLILQWDSSAPVVLHARRGTLEIDDGPSERLLRLNGSQLRPGVITYRHLSNSVHFRLELAIAGNVSVTETADWKP